MHVVTHVKTLIYIVADPRNLTSFKAWRFISADVKTSKDNFYILKMRGYKRL